MIAQTTGTAHVPGTTPYPWPWDGRLDAGRTAVLVVCRRGADALNPVAAALVADLALLGVPAVHVSTGPPGEPAGPERLPGPDPVAAVQAGGWDGFFQSGLDPLLRRWGRHQLVVVGDGLETGVHSTLRAANDRGYECLLVADACSAQDDVLRAPALSMIEMSGGIFGAVGRAEDLLRALTLQGANR